MVYHCRSEDCRKAFSSASNRNKHEKSKGHWSKFQILPTPIVFAPDEVFDTYIDIDIDGLHLDTQSYNLLIQKATSYM